MTALKLNPISVNQDYKNEWQVHMNDFLLLCDINDKPLRNTLYRTGLMGGDVKQNYFMLLKHTEDFYDKKILNYSDNKNPKHLKSEWVILDKHGNEKVVFNQFKSPYLVRDSCIYSLDSKYYNIETGELYCSSHGAMHSEEFLFLNNEFDTDKSKRGVLKINKKTGTFELYK